MNILYIGPYREYGDDSEMSRLYLMGLAKKHNVTARPVFLSEKTKHVSQDILTLEKNELNEYDCCIQHLPLNMLSYSARFKNNIAIPISEPLTRINSTPIINQLNLFDSVLVNSQNEEVMLVRSEVKSKIKKITCPINLEMAKEIKDKKFDFGIHNNNHKFYFFGNYREDLEIINKIILSFYLAFRCRDKTSLIMVLEGSGQDQEHLNKTRKEMKEQIEISPFNNSINEIYIFDRLSEIDQLIVHNSCNTLLSLYPRDSMLQKEYALFFGNNIIDKNNTNVVEVPYSRSSNNIRYSPGDAIESIITQSIVSNMIHYANNGNSKSPKDIPINKTSDII